ncbi:Glycosyltransferase involved in cell wall bisynthesis [Frankineae bacterium MT45]|nr:Glycosyltransferase involved in cell wall bisynthesis [Frankineae bacterium MT45]
MRVLWISPWLRSLARVQVDALARTGIETLLITTQRHPESDGVRGGEVIVDQSLKHPASWLDFLTAYRRARRFAPDIVVVELVRDPRWLPFTRLAPYVTLVHDDAPHDATEVPPKRVRQLRSRLDAHAARVVVFSDFVAEQLKKTRGIEAYPIPLTSDLADDQVPPFVDADGRRNFVMVGRIGPYKNVDVVLEAWRRHREGATWRGDELVIIGDGAPPPATATAESVQLRTGAFRYREVVEELAAAKGALVHYRSASQSGAQVLAMQLGVVPIVSTVGALPAYQPSGEGALGIDDIPALAAAFDALADPQQAARRGAAASQHYQHHYRADESARALRSLFDEILR